MLKRLVLVVAVVLCGAVLGGGWSLALEPEEMLSDPQLEERAREISKGLRCVVCQNQSIDDSDADIAADMRRLVRERLVEGDTDRQVLDRMVEYYGDYVLLTPRFSLENFFIWAAAPLALLVGLGWYFRRTGRFPGAPSEPVVSVAGASMEAGAKPLTPEEQARLNALLKD
ncbi:MAG: cytochrome c-type biogenesis protein [Pseudomonadota bacterium]